MTREEMIAAAAQALSDACHEGRNVYEWNVAAEVVVGALLPQVTPTELIALVDGSLVIDIDGRPWRKRGWRWETWAQKQVTTADLIEDSGPLTIVWQPCTSLTLDASGEAGRLGPGLPALPADLLRRDDRYAAGWQSATAHAIAAAARSSMSSSELATLRDALTPGGGS